MKIVSINSQFLGKENYIDLLHFCLWKHVYWKKIDFLTIATIQFMSYSIYIL